MQGYDSDPGAISFQSHHRNSWKSAFHVDGEGDRGVIKLVPKEGSSGSGATGLSHPYYWAAFILIGNGL